MYMINKFVKPALVGLGFTLLAACQHTSVSAPGPQQNVMRNKIQMVRLPLEIQREADNTDTLSSVTEGSIHSFLASVNAGYGDVIMLDGPNASPQRIAAVEALIKRTSLAYGGTSALGTKPEDGAIMLYVERYIVDTPNCNYWPDTLSGQAKNNDSSFHGCTTRINLGLMIANPRDLISGHYSGTTTSTAVGALYGPGKAAGAQGANEAVGAVDSLMKAVLGGDTGSKK